MLSLEEIFIGTPRDARQPLFRSVAEIARDISNLDFEGNPYYGRERTCAKHLSALFRGGSSARLSQALYDVLREVLQRRIDQIEVEQIGAWQVPADEFVFEDAARAYTRKLDRSVIDSGLKSFVLALQRAETIQLVWSSDHDDLVRVAELLSDVLENTKAKVEFYGMGVWSALHATAVKQGLNWSDAYDLVLSWKLAKRVRATAYSSSLSVAVLDGDKLSKKVFFIFPEDEGRLVVYKLPPRASDELELRISAKAFVVSPDMEIGDEGEYKLAYLEMMDMIFAVAFHMSLKDDAKKPQEPSPEV